MATYAVLGATGNCGTALIESLLRSSPEARIHAFCRNKSKLLRLLPDLETEPSKVDIFEGGIHDDDLLRSCIRGCHAVFLAISTNDNVPGCRMAQDTAAAVLRALDIDIDSKDETKLEPRAMPKLVLLSSATLDDQLSCNTPPLVRWILLKSASHVYDDLRQAERLLRAHQDVVSTIFIKPGGLSVERTSYGHALSLREEKSPLTYVDLANAMVEAADDPDGRYDMRNVGVVYTEGPAGFPSGAPMCIAMGLVRHFAPWLHPFLPSTGPG